MVGYVEMLVDMLGQDYNKTIDTCYHFYYVDDSAVLVVSSDGKRTFINFHLSCALSLLTWVYALILTQESIKSDSQM